MLKDPLLLVALALPSSSTSNSYALFTVVTAEDKNKLILFTRIMLAAN